VSSFRLDLILPCFRKKINLPVPFHRLPLKNQPVEREKTGSTGSRVLDRTVFLWYNKEKIKIISKNAGKQRTFFDNTPGTLWPPAAARGRERDPAQTAFYPW